MLLGARKNFNALRGRVFLEISVLNSLGLNSVCGNPVQEERHLSVDTCVKVNGKYDYIRNKI
jgi:hypothetical protein